MTDLTPTSYHQVVQRNQADVQRLIEHGATKPFLTYHLLIYTFLPLSALLIPRRKGSKYVRPVIFALTASIAIDTMKSRRMLLGANGYMLGLVTSWWIFWCGTLLVFNNPEKDFKRIEKTTIAPCDGSGPEHALLNGNEQPVDRNHGILNGGAIPSSNPVGSRRSTAPPVRLSAANHALKKPSHVRETLTWQPYPQPFLHRLNWSLGLLFNMRGPEWSWRISTLGPLPASVREQLNPCHPDAPYGPNCAEDPYRPAGYRGAKARLKASFLTFLKSYLCLDIAKCLMMRDPYFWGVVSSSLPPPFPSSLFSGYPVLLRVYRLHLTAFGIVSSLAYACSLNPITFLGLSLAFPKASRSLTSVPLDAPWLYSTAFGPFVESVINHGLAGCWGQWWHQLFRFGFTSTARWALSLLPVKLAPSSQVRRIVMAFLAFIVSGTIHACGSYTQHAKTKPLSGPFLYFSTSSCRPLGSQFRMYSPRPSCPRYATVNCHSG